MHNYKKEFITYAIEHKVLRFGEFKLKSGRISPYFFNTGLFNFGSQLSKLGQFYAQAYQQCGVQADVLYGPAYKGIPLVSATAIAMAESFNHDMPFSFNRKEVKDHGEGGNLVGAPLHGNVMILDDVITAGTSVRESVNIIKSMGAQPCGVLISLDRQEKGQKGLSATDEITDTFKIPVHSVISLNDIVLFLMSNDEYSSQLATIERYQEKHGCA